MEIIFPGPMKNAMAVLTAESAVSDEVVLFLAVKLTEIFKGAGPIQLRFLQIVS